MKKIALTSIIALCMACPAFADPAPSYDIDAGDESANCVSDTLHATSGNVNLNANWDPNTVNITYYSDNSEFTTGECVYDQSLLIPQTEPTKTGYTFGGWKVRVAAAPSQPQQCSLSNLDPTIGTSWDTTHIQYRSFYGDHGASWGDQTGLNNGDWVVKFDSYGTIKGIARCSTVGEEMEYAQTGNPTDDLDLEDLDNGAQYCWCQATQYTPNGGSQCSVASPSWGFYGDLYDDDDANGCAYNCADACARYVRGDADFRRAIFGITQ